jgi:hypothetical protein
LEFAWAPHRATFVNASLLQLQAAAQLPFGGISETATNAALALIEAAAPRNEVEGALAVQMACTHAAAMSVLASAAFRWLDLRPARKGGRITAGKTARRGGYA